MSTPPQEPRGNWGPIVALSHHPTFCGLKNEKYLSSFDVWALVEPLRRSRSDWWASHLFVRLSERVNDKNTFVRGSFACCVCPGPTSTQPVIMSPSVAWLKLTQVQGLCGNGPELQGADSSFYLPISLWILLQYWQTDSPALWGDRSPPSAGYHFQLNPFI